MATKQNTTPAAIVPNAAAILVGKAFANNDDVLARTQDKGETLTLSLAKALTPFVKKEDKAAAVAAWDAYAAGFIQGYAKAFGCKLESAGKAWGRHYNAALKTFDGVKPQTSEAKAKQDYRAAQRETADLAMLTSPVTAQADRDAMETKVRKSAKNGDETAKRMLQQAEPVLASIKEAQQQTADLMSMYTGTVKFFTRTKLPQSAAIKTELEAIKAHLIARGIAFAQ